MPIIKTLSFTIYKFKINNTIVNEQSIISNTFYTKNLFMSRYIQFNVPFFFIHMIHIISRFFYIIVLKLKTLKIKINI